jgi:fatty acid desaturase
VLFDDCLDFSNCMVRRDLSWFVVVPTMTPIVPVTAATSLKTDIPVKRNVAIIIIQLVAVFLCCQAAAHVRDALSLLGLALVFGILMNSVYAIIHEAEHAMLFPDRRWNDLAGAVMALFFPAPFHLIRQGHLAHHEYPTAPWVHLPALGSTTQIEKRGFLPWSYFKMWRGPSKATERVENQYAGRVIR